MQAKRLRPGRKGKGKDTKGADTGNKYRMREQKEVNADQDVEIQALSAEPSEIVSGTAQHGEKEAERRKGKGKVRKTLQLSRPYKIRRDMGKMNVNAEFLREKGLGLFHLGALGRLMRCVFSVYFILSRLPAIY